MGIRLPGRTSHAILPDGDDPEKLAEIANVGDADFTAQPPAAPRAQRHFDSRPRHLRVHRAGGKVPPERLRALRHAGERQAVVRYDLYADNYYARSRTRDPAGPESASIPHPPGSPGDPGDCRAVHGGPWNYGPEFARCSYRDYNYREGHNNETGFRVVRSLSDSEIAEVAKKAKPKDAKKADKIAH